MQQVMFNPFYSPLDIQDIDLLWLPRKCTLAIIYLKYLLVYVQELLHEHHPLEGSHIFSLQTARKQKRSLSLRK